ncbi:MAG TPA: nitroreductase family protein, partial [Thauera aminoaromatica]|nr:nitroreductase family protein [Thauera aminoaromatica]
MPPPSSRLQARYGQESIPAEIALNPLVEHLLDHRSVRAYLPDPVTDGELAAIVAAAQSAASSSNLNVWSVVAVRDAERRARLAELAGNQAHVREAPLQLVWLAD